MGTRDTESFCDGQPERRNCRMSTLLWALRARDSLAGSIPVMRSLRHPRRNSGSLFAVTSPCALVALRGYRSQSAPFAFYKTEAFKNYTTRAWCDVESIFLLLSLCICVFKWVMTDVGSEWDDVEGVIMSFTYLLLVDLLFKFVAFMCVEVFRIFLLGSTLL